MFEENSSANDTLTSNGELQVRLLASLSPSERMERFFSLFQTSRAFLSAGIKARYPRCSEIEFRKRKASLLLGRDFAIKQYGWDPEIEGY